MSESPISLRDETGVERFRGTQSPGGGSVPLYVQDTDPGAVGGGAIWINTSPDPITSEPTIQVRNIEDDGWGGLTANSPVSVDAGAGSFPNSASSVSAGIVSTAALDLRADDGTFVSAGVKLGSIDPSAGAGVGAGAGSLYLRNNAGTGELWLKTGAADTAWTQVVTP